MQLGDHDVGLQDADELERFGRRPRLTDHAEPGLGLEQPSQRLPEQPLWVDQEDPVSAAFLGSGGAHAGRGSEIHRSRVPCAVVCATA